MSRDAAYQSQIENEYDDLVLGINVMYEILKQRMGNFQDELNLINIIELKNCAENLADDAKELLDFLKERGYK